MSLNASLVLTTIRDSDILENYVDNFRRHDHTDQVEIFLIPDRKTPPRAMERYAALARAGVKISCPAVSEQEDFLRRIGFPPHVIPYDSDNRRNVGYLMALESGSDFVISIDDDNYCRPEADVFAGHAIVCESAGREQLVETEDGWFNVCDLLELDRPDTTYPRGFPYYARHRRGSVRTSSAAADVHINAGLWLQAPDIDAINWLVAPTQATAFKGPSLALGRRTWSPINAQNVAMRRAAAAAYYYIKMQHEPGARSLRRYSDIISGYFIEACVKHLGGAIRFGTPVADHRRNEHNYVQDADDEWGCIMLFEDLLPWLLQLSLSGSTHREAYTALSYCLQDAVEKQRGGAWNDITRGYFHQIAHHMRTWVRVVDTLW